MLKLKYDTRTVYVGYESVMQFCGQNMIQKGRIISDIKKYFSNGKYSEYEDNSKCSVFLDEDEIGRKAFEIYSIYSVSSIISAIKMSKNSILATYIKYILSGFDLQVNLEKIDNELISIYNSINDELQKVGKIKLDFTLADIWDVLQKSEVESSNDLECIEGKSGYELLKIYMNLISKLHKYNPQRSLVIIENADHFLSIEEYKDIIDMAKNIGCCYDIHFIFSTSLHNYVQIDSSLVEGITIFNDVIYNLPNLDNINQFLDKTYPCYKTFQEEEICNMLTTVIQYIGFNDSLIDMTSEVLLKLINQSIGLKKSLKSKVSQAEISFLFD